MIFPELSMAIKEEGGGSFYMLSALILLSAPIRGVSVRKMLEQEPPEEKEDY